MTKKAKCLECPLTKADMVEIFKSYITPGIKCIINEKIDPLTERVKRLEIKAVVSNCWAPEPAYDDNLWEERTREVNLRVRHCGGLYLYDGNLQMGYIRDDGVQFINPDGFVYKTEYNTHGRLISIFRRRA